MKRQPSVARNGLLRPSQQKTRTQIHKQAETYQAGIMGLLGMSTKAIASQTGLSAGQILYRLKRTHVSRADYRNGNSEVAEFILQKVRPFAEQKFTQLLQEHLDLQHL